MSLDDNLLNLDGIWMAGFKPLELACSSRDSYKFRHWPRGAREVRFIEQSCVDWYLHCSRSRSNRMGRLLPQSHHCIFLGTYPRKKIADSDDIYVISWQSVLGQDHHVVA